ncbi:hypothetical protein SAMN05192558_106257 [Actinokineospora alba]|uniref:PE family protein n=2 Tax=Actinokineospora alba TaxID=504798 RepID=A0A1H0PUC1_9PSEU|nr:hypothetical protein C8E96_1424 [Actinokineospora alba]SDI61933.1 hypothetical protein SAMN05421871_106195 [Actinokineospora alba]SDP08156.1 hypothetical protein SAMN05192558_106257 [Actinokineospora alba]
MDIGASLSGTVNAIAGAAIEAARTLMGGSPASGQFVVNHDNVLAAAKIIHTQAESLYELVREARFNLPIDQPGDDIVSTKVAEAWNDLLIYNDDSYATRIDEYVMGLKNLVQQLTDSAKAYGYNEEEIAAALGGGQSA